MKDDGQPKSLRELSCEWGLPEPDINLLVDVMRSVLAAGPKSTDEVGLEPDDARALAAIGVIEIDPDRWPDEYVPGNPMVLRLPGDERRWPGWKEWNL